MALAIVVIAAVVAIINHYQFRFQRVTRHVARKFFSSEDQSDAQAIMTPAWMGLLGCMHIPMHALLAFGVYWYFGWLWAVIWLAYEFVGVGISSLIVPIPTGYHCYRIARHAAQRDPNVVLTLDAEFGNVIT